MTLVQKILAQKLKRIPEIGEFIQVDIDLALANDITLPLAISELQKFNKDIKINHTSHIVVVCDHFVPNKDIQTANQVKKIRDFVEKYKIKNFYDTNFGIEHIVLPEEGFIKPGKLIIGADSHTTTYGALAALACGIGSSDFLYAMITKNLWFKVPESIKVVFKGNLKEWVSGKDLILYLLKKIKTDGANYKALEFKLENPHQLTISDRFTISNMSAECGAKFAIFEPDELTLKYCNISNIDLSTYKIQDDKFYEDIIEIDISKVNLQVAKPYLPSNVCDIEEVEGIRVDQVFIGSCTNGRIEDLRIAAKIIAKNQRRINKSTRLIIIPGSQKVYLQALKEGLIDIFIESKAIVCPPSCGPCLGGHLGVLAEGEVCLATTNRNFKGRMGDKNSYVYLASPAVAAASACYGKITHPNKI
jgi:3-isopropylmalate/(R)-2-methylmalate dehydratase large subunit